VADAPWRCSQCGTVNEPVANSCRTCGRWPSLFDLEASKIEVDAPAVQDDLYEARSVEIEQLEPEVFDVRDVDEAPMEVDAPDADPEDVEPPKPLWQRLASFIVPIGVVLYILISALADRGG
jgi:predicted  nucleic acid-binding Zn-ribbon protein